MADEPKSRILKLHNTYIGKSVLFLGCGTSLLDFDLNKVNSDIYTFGFNNFVPFYEQHWPKMKLDFFMVHDSKVLQVPFHKFHKNRDAQNYQSYGLELDIKNEYEDISPARFIIDKKLYEKTKIITCKNVIQKRIHDFFGVLTNPEWYDANPEMVKNENFLVYDVDSKVSDFFSTRIVEDTLRMPLWAKNSFCNSALPLLFYLGFTKIYLAGVDYSNKGYFFCQTNEKKLNENIYVSKEHEQFNKLMNIATHSIDHKPKIFTVDSEATTITAKDGRIKFEELT